MGDRGIVTLKHAWGLGIAPNTPLCPDGAVTERLKVTVLKTVERVSPFRGFESLLLRFRQGEIVPGLDSLSFCTRNTDTQHPETNFP